MGALACLEISVVLWLVHVVIQGAAGTTSLPFGYLFTARDAPAQPKGLLFGRATRALANYVENFTAFVALDLVLIATNHPPGFGPTLWILARIVYIPIYLLGVSYVRTVVWTISVVGLIMMLTNLAFS